ncbi:MAG: hypothetical protein CMM94_01885 [Rickettsiales bacterium]|nr:hypothetical protein [Rickettsiales bacterium]|tara:strand:- start:502 stop:1227 length:726 start_codon:yes stop_codon:yes gene_type:complete
MDELLNASAQPTNPALNNIRQETNPSKAEVGQQKLSDDFDNFMLLLTTQLKNQDPTEPLDVNQFTNQLVAFTGVEQQLATNANLEKLISMQEESPIEKGLGYIGKVVDAEGNAGLLQNGRASFAYSLDMPAEKVDVLITDASGRAVFSGNGTTFAGKNLVGWDGSNPYTGETEPNGLYFINVKARNALGEKVETKTYTTGTVTAAEVEDGELLLTVGGSIVKASAVEAVRQKPEIAAGEES